MSLDSLSPIAPARVRALVLPVGQIKRDRFATFVQRLNQEHVVQLRDISADGRPNRNMFSPLAFPDGMIFYDLLTHVPPPSHLALSPFDLYREPLAVIAIADGEELEEVAFSKRESVGGHARTMTERNIRTLYQELEGLRDAYPKVLAHQVLIFDYDPPADDAIPIPEGIQTIPPVERSTVTTMKTIMCDISSLLLAEMTTLAKSFEGMSTIDSPGQAPARPQTNGSWTSDDANLLGRRSSQVAPSTVMRSASSSGALDRSQARMSMPAPLKSLPFGSANSTPVTRSSTPARSGLSNPPTTFEDIAGTKGNNADVPGSEQKTFGSGIPEDTKSTKSENRISVQGFGPGALTERWRNKGKARATIVVGSLYLQAGRWADALRELGDGATVAKSMNDHMWHGKALELIVLSLFLLGWSGHQFQIPMICYPPNEKAPNSATKGQDVEKDDENQPRCLRNLQIIVPELLERIVGLCSRMTGEQLPPLALSEMIIRYCNILTILHLCEGKLDKRALEMMIVGELPTRPLTTSPRLTITPNRSQITNFLFRAFPSSAPELLTTADRAIILSGIAIVLGNLGFQRKKAMVVRELVSVLIGGLVEARTRGAAEVGIHPAAGLVALSAVNGHTNGSGALELGEGDIEYGVDAFLGMLCKTYGVVSFDDSAKEPATDAPSVSDADSGVISRIHSQSSSRHFGIPSIKMNILRACIHFSEALPDFNGVLKFSSDLLRTAGKGLAPGPRGEDVAPMISREEQVRLANNISKTSDVAQRLGLGHLSAEYWDEFLLRGITLDPLPPTRTPIYHSKKVLPGVTKARTSQDVDPFIYNPFSRTPDKEVERTLVTGEAASFRITLQNPYDVDVEIESIKLDTEGADFESSVESALLGSFRTQVVKVSGTPRAAGDVRVTGAIARIRGCRERRFPIFSEPWSPNTDIKIKSIGLGALERSKLLPPPGPSPKPHSVELKAISAQPIVVIKSTSLPQSSVMVLEGERQVFSVTLHNLSPTIPADLLLFSFQDSTQAPLQNAIANRDATPIELYEYELILARKQALRLRKIDDSKRYIAPGGTATFEFEILGKPGLTNGTVQIDYAYLGVPQAEVAEPFHTRQVCLDLTITVNASIELVRADILPIQGPISSSLWNRSSSEGSEFDGSVSDDQCLLMLDLRNAWPSDMQIRLEAKGGIAAVEEHILPGNTNRVMLPIPRVYLEDPHMSVPALNPSREQRQFVVSSYRIAPETERANREAFWYREKILDSLTAASWRTSGPGGPAREGALELRGLRITPRMIDAVRIDEVGIDIEVVQDTPPKADAADDSITTPTTEKNTNSKSSSNNANTVYVDEFMQFRVRLTNRTARPIHPTLRLTPSLGSRRTAPHLGVAGALDLTRKLAWHGVLQRHLPLLAARSTADVLLGAVALCRGEFEIAASVEETMLWTPPSPEKGEDGGDGEEERVGEGEEKKAGKEDGDGDGDGSEKKEEGEGGLENKPLPRRPRSDTDRMMDALLGPMERRIWHSRYPCVGPGPACLQEAPAAPPPRPPPPTPPPLYRGTPLPTSTSPTTAATGLPDMLVDSGTMIDLFPREVAAAINAAYRAAGDGMAYTVACDAAQPALEVLVGGSDRALRTHSISMIPPETERGWRCLSGVGAGAGGEGSYILDDAFMQELVVLLDVSEERMGTKFAERMGCGLDDLKIGLDDFQKISGINRGPKIIDAVRYERKDALDWRPVEPCQAVLARNTSTYLKTDRWVREHPLSIRYYGAFYHRWTLFELDGDLMRAYVIGGRIVNDD
ncbi:hypothetical protein DL766_001599 [Monosporascus sp. MC13-8B]|nr:hypothetical protein DL766_001599 [Monosporascus sp. MC13-8B]